MGSFVFGLLALASTLAPPGETAPTGVDGLSVLVVPIRFDDAELPEDARQEVRDALSEGIGRTEVREIVAAEAASCTDADCYSPVAERLGAGRFLRTTIETRERDYTISMELLRSDGSLLASRDKTCELCGLTEVAEATSNLAAVLAAKLIELDSAGPGVFDLETEPSGAKVFVDGEPVGTSPLTLSLTPGPHQLVLRADGFGELKRTVDATSGVQEELRFSMEPVDEFGRPLSQLRRSPARPVGWALIGVGVVATATGGALLGVDGRNIADSCTAESPPDDEGECPRKLDTFAGGLSAVIAGSVGLVVGVALVAWEAKRHAKRRERLNRAHWRLGPTPGGIAVRF